MTGQDQEIALRVASGERMADIACEYGLTREAVRGRVKRAGLRGIPGRRNGRPDHLHREFDRLDALSRTRALTDLESLQLERIINLIDGGRK